MEKPRPPAAVQGKKGPAGLRRGDTGSWTVDSRPAMTRAGHFTAVLESRPDWTQQPHSVPRLLTRREGILKGGAAHPEGVGFNHQRSKPRPAGLPFLRGDSCSKQQALPLPPAHVWLVQQPPFPEPHGPVRAKGSLDAVFYHKMGGSEGRSPGTPEPGCC